MNLEVVLGKFYRFGLISSENDLFSGDFGRLKNFSNKNVKFLV